MVDKFILMQKRNFAIKIHQKYCHRYFYCPRMTIDIPQGIFYPKTGGSNVEGIVPPNSLLKGLDKESKAYDGFL